MEVDEDHMQACKFPRIRSGGNKIGPNGDDEDEGEAKRVASGNDIGRLCGWPSSRIVRVSRASGGKDRHSKVWTSKGLRDRRVRLSVTTAIQFYDLQDRLGYDQPSKAVDWLLKAAESSISELPSLNALSFPNTPKQLSDEKRSSGGTTEHGFDSNDLELDMGPNYHHQNQNVSLSKSACSSTSETSKGSGGLSISQSEFRIKPRERPRRRAVEKEKEKESKALISGHHPNVTTISQSFSFTELLTSGANNNSCSHRNSAAPHLHKSSSTQWPNAPMNFCSTGLNQTSSDLSGQIQLGNSLPQSMMVSPNIVTSGDQHQHHELQHFSFVQDNVVPVASDYSQNLSISSGLAGYNRGTLQSNLTPSLLPQLHHHRFSPIDGPNSSPFFTSPAVSISTTTETQHQHHQFPAGFDARLHLYYGDADRHSDHQFPYTSQEKKANK